MMATNIMTSLNNLNGSVHLASIENACLPNMMEQTLNPSGTG